MVPAVAALLAGASAGLVLTGVGRAVGGAAGDEGGAALGGAYLERGHAVTSVTCSPRLRGTAPCGRGSGCASGCPVVCGVCWGRCASPTPWSRSDPSSTRYSVVRENHGPPVRGAVIDSQQGRPVPGRPAPLHAPGAGRRPPNSGVSERSGPGQWR